MNNENKDRNTKGRKRQMAELGLPDDLRNGSGAPPLRG
jgi:hypothetical protein